MLRDDPLHSEPEEYVYQPSPSLWQRIRGMFSRDARLHDLNWAITAYPETAANYVLRGELLLRRGDLFGAIADFRKGFELAAEGVENEDWGMVAQVLQDRALAGLRDALYRTARYNLNTKLINE
ncbi:MAG: hypothetical protein ABI835_02455 [Chloroflexota bacterium]